MAIDTVIRKIDGYLKKESIGPLIVDIQNKEDLAALVTHYKLPQNTFIYASNSELCKVDEFPDEAKLLNKLSRSKSICFVQEVSTFYMLKGEQAVLQVLQEFVSMTTEAHVIIITYQCSDFLQRMVARDRRLESRICVVEGALSPRPKIVFTKGGICPAAESLLVKGFRGLASAIESESAEMIYVETAKSKRNYPLSLYNISEIKNAYEILGKWDEMTNVLPEATGTEDDWEFVLSEFQMYESWEQLISSKVGNVHNLDMAILSYQRNQTDNRWMWLYFIGLKMFGAGSDLYLNEVVSKSMNLDAFKRNIYRAILDIEPTDSVFDRYYTSRKSFLNAMGNPLDQVANFCEIVLGKEKNALYYLTDSSAQEKELVFRLLDKYGLNFEKTEVLSILKKVYPDLYNYLMPYYFKINLLDTYFEDYKYQKVINKIFPEFMQLVEQQATSREYNTLLQPRSAVIESIDIAQTQTYFTDAMGVEYLGYIMSKCQELQLMAKVTVCRSELPSITSCNKEFWNVLTSTQYPIIPFDKIDKIKHHGEEGFDYSRADGKLPTHLIRELELINKLLTQIKSHLINANSYNKAILIADHGASRLAVIHETESLWEMQEKGVHSGRCCPKSDVDVRPDSVTDADEFWALANYDRFKGSRKANVEVHGGATLEEIAVPIIEITCLNTDVEVKIMPVDGSIKFTGVPEILVSFRKKAAIKIFATQKLMDVSVEIDGHFYDAKAIDDNFYVVEEMSDIRRAKTYSVNVYACGNRIATDIPLCVKKEGGNEKSIL